MQRMIAVFVIFSLILTGCSGGNMDVDMIDTHGELIELPNRSLGNANFKVDSVNAESIECLADGKEKSITIKDSSGIEWTLTIPGDALLTEEIITITPLTDIEVNTVTGARFNGLMLEPEGLRFLSNSTIRIRKPGENITWLVFMAGKDGSELVFSPADAIDGGVTATVGHFSTIFVLPADDPAVNNLIAKAEEEYEKAVDAANMLLKKPLEIPAPPSISWECLSDKEIAKAEEYAESMVKEEFEIAERLVSADKAICLKTGKEADFSMSAKLLKRSLAKVDKLIKVYSPQPEKLLAVFHAANRVWRNSYRIVEVPPISSFLGWAQDTRDYYINRLIQDHEYKSLGAAIELDRMNALMGGTTELDKIMEALTFTLTIETILTIPGYTITVKGKGILKPIRGALKDKTLFLQGVETLGYKYNGFDEDLKILPEAFPVKMQIRNWEPCKTHKIHILIESLGSDEEEHVYELADGNQSYFDPIVNDFAEGFFEQEITEVPYTHEDGSVEAVEMIGFNVDLRDGQATAAVKTMERKQPETEAAILVHMQLEHTP